MVLERKSGAKQRHKSKTALLALVMGAVWLTGCGSPVKQTFDLSAPTATGQSLKAPARRNVQLSVGTPGALKPLDSQNIVIRGADGSIAYLKAAQWSDHLTDMVQARLMQALEDSHHFGGVGRPRDGINANYQLMTELRVFGVDLDAQGRFANVQISARILDDKTGGIRKTKLFSAQRRLTGTSNADYALALDAAFAAVLQEMVNWTARSL